MSLVSKIKPYIPVRVKQIVKGWLIEANRLTDKSFREYLETGWYRVSYGDKYPNETVMVLQRVDSTSGEYSDWLAFLPSQMCCCWRSCGEPDTRLGRAGHKEKRQWRIQTIRCPSIAILSIEQK